MNFVEEDYDKFNKEGINNLNRLNYNFDLNERFVHVKDENGNYFQCQTPFLKVLKPIHTTLNKKKTVAKKYIILEINDDLDFNNQIAEFMLIINKIHETSQEKIREKSLEWFNTEFDDIGLDIKVRRPIDQQKDNEFIRISIPKNSELENEISNLSKGSYILSNIIFKGLKISNDLIMEEWEIKNFITQENYELLNKKEYIDNNLTDIEVISHILEEEHIEKNDDVENMKKVLEDNLENIENLVKKNIDELNNIQEQQKEENITQQDIEIESQNQIKNIIIKKNKKTNNKKITSEKTTSERIIENKKKKSLLENSDTIKKSSKKLIFT
jgi:hypothetical protein